MDDFLANVGILAIAFGIISTYKKILEWNSHRSSGSFEDERVYQAAELFARGAPFEGIQTVLAECYTLDTADMEKIMSLASSHRANKDGGYKAFIKSVNSVLDEDIYDETRHAGNRPDK